MGYHQLSEAESYAIARWRCQGNSLRTTAQLLERSPPRPSAGRCSGPRPPTTDITTPKRPSSTPSLGAGGYAGICTTAHRTGRLSPARFDANGAPSKSSGAPGFMDDPP
ncbi:MAG: helix-turn-helix domain-containing protein [Gammaproteobacteria bacterium]|nr:helix-turn-helix domain-containing protein [Gammaproteobacteria bacterium]